MPAELKPDTPVYEMDGALVHSLADFYRLIGEAINGPGGYFGHNFGSLEDCLRGDFGTPDGEWALRIHHSEAMRANLGYEQTVRELEARLALYSSSTQVELLKELEAAKNGHGEAVFVWVLESFRRFRHWVVLDLQ